MIRDFLKNNPRLQVMLPYLALVAAVFAAYSNVYGNVFLFDDQTLIQMNRHVLGQLPLSHIFISSAAGGAGIINDFYRPLQVLLYALIYQLFGLSIIAYHALNVGLHVANACLVYALGRKLGFRPWAVFFGSLIWALHPLHTEAVTYISATADTLNVVFCLIVLLMVLPDMTLRRVLMACPVYVLALMSKETAVLLPMLAICCLCLTSPQRQNIRTYLPSWPLWVLAIGYTVLRFTVFDFQSADHSFDSSPVLHLYATNLIVRIYTCLATITYYFQLMIYPVGLHYERQFPVYVSILNPDVYTGLIIFLSSGVLAAWALWRKVYPLAWGIVWFWAAHSLETGILLPLNMRLLEHWMYVPMIGLCLGFAETGAMVLSRKWLVELQGPVGLAASLVALTFGIMTFERNTVWHDEFTFYPDILKYGEPSTRAINNLANAYANRGNYDKAIALLRQSQSIIDSLPEVHQNIAHAMILKDPDWRQHPQEIIAELKRAMELSPNFLPACDGLIYVYKELGDQKNTDLYRARAAEIKKTLMP